jgi:hypothetical protein
MLNVDLLVFVVEIVEINKSVVHTDSDEHLLVVVIDQTCHYSQHSLEELYWFEAIEFVVDQDYIDHVLLLMHLNYAY